MVEHYINGGSTSVQALQSLVNICNSELSFLNMIINTKKSACMRFGSKYRNVCADVMASRSVINWMTSSTCIFRKLYKVPLVKTKPDFIRLLITFLGK